MESSKNIDADIQKDGSEQTDEPKKLSVAQKKKLKEKAKKEAEAAKKTEQDGEGGEAAQPETAAGGKGKKKGKMNAAAALALEKKRLLEEMNKKQKEEEDKLREEELRNQKIKDEEERIKKEEADRVRNEKKAKIEELKKQGKYLTKKQLEQKKLREARKKELIAQGLIPEDQESSSDEDNAKAKASVVIKRKPNKKKNKEQEQQKDQEEEEKSTPAQPLPPKQKKEEKPEQQVESTATEAEVGEAEESDAVDDWENADLDEIVEKAKVNTDAQMLAQTQDEDTEQALKAQQDKDMTTKQKAAETGGQVKTKKKKVEATDDSTTAGTDIFEKNDTEEAKLNRLEQRNRERQMRLKAKTKKKNDSKFRCPIICILGHVDTGKTLILDKLRKTNVQAGEAGGITQQIGATYFPREYIEGHQKRVEKWVDVDLQLPGFLVIDTPGHESFTNLRSRGSSLCDAAVLVVDIMHGLEQQTLESMELLRQKKCPFIIALNKIDRIFEWKSKEFNGVQDSLKVQLSHSDTEFKDRVQKAILAFAQEGFNAILYWENKDLDEFVSLCPTSAITGEGLPDLITYLSKFCQERIPQQLQERPDDFECTVLEVKVIEGHGTTIDVVLVNGFLKIQDTIVLQGFNGAIVTQIRALLTPQPLKEMRVKGQYVHHQKIKGAMGIKISAPGLEMAIAGSELLKANGEAEIEDAKAEIEDNLVDILDKYVDKTRDGVCVQASTLGSLEALLEFLKTSKIPVCSISIGPVYKKDVLKASKALAQEHVKKEFATILAFDVRVTPDAHHFAEQEGIKIFTANIIYHLFDEFTAYYKACEDERKANDGGSAIFPCALEVVKEAIFNRGNPIILGVNVKAGVLKVGTPLCVPDKENLKIGVVESIELNKKSMTKVGPKDGSVAIRVSGQSHVMFGRHFDETNQVCSLISRRSIDCLKEFYREEMTNDDWKLVKVLKAKYHIE